MSEPVTIPSDVDREDRILGNFTARQVLVLAVTGLVLYGGWWLLRGLVPGVVYLAVAVALGAVVFVGITARREGITLAQWAWAGLAHRLWPRRLLARQPSTAAAPEWLDQVATGDASPLTGSLSLPPNEVDEAGVLDLGRDGLAMLATASPVNFALRTPAEQRALTSAFARYLHGLSAPVQILVRAHRLDVTEQVDQLRETAQQLPHPALSAAAAEHADYVEQLAGRTELLRRQILLIVREPHPGARDGAPRGFGGAGQQGAGETTRVAAAARLARRGRGQRDVEPRRGGRHPVERAARRRGVGRGDPAGRAGSGQPGDRRRRRGHHRPRAVARSLMMRLWPKKTTPHPTTSDNGPASPFVPEAIDVAPRHLRIGDEWVASFAITGYPREVYPGWLHPLLTYPARLDVSVHIAPIDPQVAADRLRKQLAKFESSRAHTDARGGLVDPQAEAATDDAHALSEQLARGQARLFRLGLVLTVHASSQHELAEQASAVRALASSLLLQPTPTTYRALAGWVSTLPLGLDQIEATRTLDTAALAAAFPFTSPDVPGPDPTSAGTSKGVLYGLNLGSQSLVHWDRFSAENYNAVILGRSGSGKSYFVKLETLRSLYRGVPVAIIDPEDEYARLARAIGGTHLPLGADVRINPLELGLHTRHDGRRTAPADALHRRSLFCHTLLPVLFGQSLSAEERAVLDTAVLQTYAHAGITDDPRSWTRPAPCWPTCGTAWPPPTRTPPAGRPRSCTHSPMGPTPACSTGPARVSPTGLSWCSP